MHQRGEAMKTFVSNYHLLRCVGDQIQSTHDLANLCLVSRSFHSAFTPPLYHELNIAPSLLLGEGSEEFDENGLEGHRLIQNNPHLRYTRSIVANDLSKLSHGKPFTNILRQVASNLETLR